MNKHILLAVTLMLLLFSGTAEARRKRAKMHLFSTKRKMESAAITIKSSKAFIVGSNIYVLYVDGRHFDTYEEDISDPYKHRLTFYVPMSDYNQLKKNSRMFLTYGYVYEDKVSEEQMMEVCKANRVRCWALGRFRKKRLG